MEQTLTFTMLELKGLWIRATGGNTSRDKELDQAAETAVDKVWRAEKRMGSLLSPPSCHHCGRAVQTSATS